MSPGGKRRKLNTGEAKLVSAVKTAFKKRGPKKTLGKRLARVEKTVKAKAIQRHYTQAQSGSMAGSAASPVRYLWAGCKQGSGIHDRVGSDAFLQTSIFKGVIHFPERSANFQPQMVRVLAGLIRKDAMVGTSQITASQMCVDLFGTGVTAPYIYSQYALRQDQASSNPGLGDKYIIKYDRLIKQRPGAIIDSLDARHTVPDAKYFQIMMNFKNVRAIWPQDLNSTTTAYPPDQYCPFLLFIGEHDGQFVVNMHNRQWFTNTSVL